ncbi:MULTISPECIES: RnfH family protein [Larsenimonas]|uniref:UPF0125 protein QC825_13635 n=2 Tax=Larsenimonas suaedae TaxID=1851019 RepID=A0ABU1GZY6_9GAMM|nr:MULTISPECIES: RnfH family protein [Larsenimonas]MDR5897111.1 RnfH family protein [Larsenimonas suaedae]
MADQAVEIEVVYALPGQQFMKLLRVEHGTTVRAAVLQSGLDQEAATGLTRTMLENAPVGVFGVKLRAPEHNVVAQGDRVEVYRPLLCDPKKARIARANKKG